MRITTARAWQEDIALARPYTIARGSTDAVEMAFTALCTDDGLTGHGMASPATEVTGETRAAALAELQQACAAVLPGCDAADAALPGIVQARCRGPAALAALDMALLDLRAQAAGVALADWFGRVHEPLPTSVTIGCKPVAETLAEAAEYRARGFRVFKVRSGSIQHSTSSGSRGCARRMERPSCCGPMPTRGTTSAPCSVSRLRHGVSGSR